MSDELYNASYDLWKTDCDEYEHCIIPADEWEPYSRHEDDHFRDEGKMVEHVADVSNMVGGYRPLSAKYTY
jgi:hypothetical protein